MTLNQFSRMLFRLEVATRDARAIQQSVRTGSVKPLGRRLVRKALWRGFGRAMRKGGL